MYDMYEIYEMTSAVTDVICDSKSETTFFSICASVERGSLTVLIGCSFHWQSALEKTNRC